MTEGTWRPLGVEDEAQVAEYDALHDGVPSWMASEYWGLVQQWITADTLQGYTRFTIVNTRVVLPMAQILRIQLKSLDLPIDSPYDGEARVPKVMQELKQHPHPLQIADYLIGHSPLSNSERARLESLLARSNSAWTVGERSGHHGLVRRVPTGVQEAADSVMDRAPHAGRHLAKAWESLYGLAPDASVAYSSAIKAIEDAAVPVVCPSNPRATLGTVIAQMKSQKGWALPMHRPTEDPPVSTIIRMMEIVWRGQHDRHAGQNETSAPMGTQDATIAVSMAVTLVNLFHSKAIQRLQS